MIGLKVKNLPSAAKSWMPELIDYNTNHWMPVSTLSPESAYGFTVPSGKYQVSVIAYGSAPGTSSPPFNMIDDKIMMDGDQVAWVDLVDGKTYTFDFATGKFVGGIPWKWIGIGVGVVAALTLLPRLLRR